MSSKNKISRNNYFLLAVLFIILGLIISTTTALPLRLTFLNYAYAHSLPVTENPAPNSIIPKAALPSKLTIDFSERPSPAVSTIQVLNSQNELVNNGDFKIIGDDDREAMTTLDTKKLTDGVYTVSWQTQSLDDGHIARGSYVFGIGNVGPGAASITAGKTQPAPKIQAVTSDLDGIIKWPLIVSQAAVVGGIFSHLFLWENFGNKIRIKTGGGGSAARYDNDYDKTSLHWLRRFSLLLVASSIAILVAGSILLILQITELSIHNSIPADWKVFVSQLSGPSGIAWIMRSLTSLVVIASVVSYYYYKRNTQKMAINSNIKSRKRPDDRKSERKKIKMYLPLYVALVAGSFSILANSITSHNAGVHFLPSLSISLDWLHFMAVSIWVGGLFYISSILLSAIRSKATAMITTTTTTTTTNTTTTSTKSTSNSERTRSVVLYYLALLLPRFSLLATISLGVIGVSGLYAAWIQLHSLTALFTSPYGNILIIKLLAALPLVLLGGYHQLRLHRDMALVADTGRRGRGGRGGRESDGNSSKDGSVGNSVQVSQTLKNKINNGDNNNDDSNNPPTNNNTNPVNDNGKLKNIPSKFSKTIKVESLIAIAVLLAASLLTITSPPAMNMGMPASYISTSSLSGMSGMSGSMQPVKNSTYSVQTKIMNVNTKIEINPFYAGFNTFKVTFKNTDGKPNTKVYAAELTFTNTAANIGPIVANLHKIRPGVFSITGAYVSQPGEWDIAMAAQRQSDFDLNYEFNAKVASAPPPSSQSSTQEATTGANLANNAAANAMKEAPPQFNSFAWLAIVLAGAVVLLSAYYYRRSKKELRKTIEMLEAEHLK